MTVALAASDLRRIASTVGDAPRGHATRETADGTLEVRYLFHAVGGSRGPLDLDGGEEVAAGLCVEVAGRAGDLPTIEQLPCPPSLGRVLGPPFGSEPVVVDELRPVEPGPDAPGLVDPRVGGG